MAQKTSTVTTEAAVPPATEELRQRHAQAVAALAAAKDKHRTAALDTNIHPGDSAMASALKAAAAEVSAAERAASDLAAAVEASEIQERAKSQAQQEADFAQRKAAILELAAKRDKAAATYQKAASKLAEARVEMLTLSSDIRAAWPLRDPDLDAMLMKQPDVDMVARLTLVREGVAWAGPNLSLPGGIRALPTIAERIAKANAEIAARLENAAP